MRKDDVIDLLFPIEPGTTKGKESNVAKWLKQLIEAEYIGSREAIIPSDFPERQKSMTTTVLFLEKRGRDALASSQGVKAREVDWRREHRELGEAEVAHLLLTNRVLISIDRAVQRLQTGWQLEQSDLPASVEAEALDLLLRVGYSPQRVKQRLWYLLWHLEKEPGQVEDPARWLREAVALPQMAKPAGFSPKAIRSPFAQAIKQQGYALTTWLTHLQLKRFQEKYKLTSYLGGLYPDYEFDLRHPNGREYHICLEIDRGTENLNNRQMQEKDSSIATKVKKYVDIAFSQRPSIYEATRGKPSDALRIWFVTTRGTEGIRKTIKENGGGNRFAVISHLRIRPDLMFERPVWQLAGKESGHYVPIFTWGYQDQLKQILKRGQLAPDEISQWLKQITEAAAAQLTGWDENSGIPYEAALASRADFLAQDWLQVINEGIDEWTVGAGE